METLIVERVEIEVTIYMWGCLALRSFLGGVWWETVKYFFLSQMSVGCDKNPKLFFNTVVDLLICFTCSTLSEFLPLSGGCQEFYK